MKLELLELLLLLLLLLLFFIFVILFILNSFLIFRNYSRSLSALCVFVSSLCDREKRFLKVSVDTNQARGLQKCKRLYKNVSQ